MHHGAQNYKVDQINNCTLLPWGHICFGIHFPSASIANPFLHIHPGIQTIVQILGSGSPHRGPQCPLHGENTSLLLTSQSVATEKKHYSGQPIKS